MNQKQPIKQGVCEFCFEQEDIDRGLKVNLFLVDGKLMCGYCANQHDADIRQAQDER